MKIVALWALAFLYPVAALGAERYVAVGAFTQDQAGGSRPELVRVLPLFLSAELRQKGIAVVGLRSGEDLYLEHRMKELGYVAPAADRQFYPAAWRIDGHYRTLGAADIEAGIKLFDLTTPGKVRLLNEKQTERLEGGLGTLADWAVSQGMGVKRPAAALREGSTVLVGGFLSDPALPREWAWLAEDRMSLVVQESGRYRQVDRRTIRQIEKEMSMSLIGAVSAGRPLAVGRMVGADALLFGGLIQGGNEIGFTLLMQDVQTGEIMNAWTGTVSEPKLLSRTIDVAAKMMLSEGARAVANKIVHDEGRSPDAEFSLYRAVGLFERAQQDKADPELHAALDEADRAILLDSKLPAAKYLRGKILVKMKRYAEATDEFQEVTRRFPASIWAGESHKELGDRKVYALSEQETYVRTGMSTLDHYKKAAIDFPNSYGAWEATLKVAQILCSPPDTRTAFEPILSRLIELHPDQADAVLLQWSRSFRAYKKWGLPGNPQKEMDIFRRMTPKGWWQKWKVLGIDFADDDSPWKIKRLDLAREAAAVTEDAEGQLLLLSLLPENYPMGRRTAAEERLQIVRRLNDDTRRFRDETLSAPHLTIEEKAQLLYKRARRLMLPTFGHCFDVSEAAATLLVAVLRGTPNVRPWAIYAAEDIASLLGEYERERRPDPELGERFAAPVGNWRTIAPEDWEVVIRFYHQNPVTPNRREFMTAFLDHLKSTEQTHTADRLYAAMRSRNTHDPETWESYLDQITRRDFPERMRSRDRDFAVRFARPAVNFLLE